MLNKLMIGCLLSSCVVISTNANAENPSISFGYAQSKIQDFKNVRGINVLYRYEWDSPFSAVGSFSYMKGNTSQRYIGRDHSTIDSNKFKDEIDVAYYTLLAGPAYRINDYVSIYTLAGLAHTKVKLKAFYLSQYLGEASTHKTSFAYGAGVAINPLDNIVVNIGYEGSKVQGLSVNGFNVSAGYRF